jgi:hypothetical protein
MRRRTAGIAAALLLAASLLAPGPGRGDELSESYFPLTPGLRWEYTVTSDQGRPLKLVITNLDPREVNGVTVTPRRWDLGGSTFIELMKKDDTGIYRYAEQKNDTAPPALVTPMECHLKFPIALDNNWTMATKVGPSLVNLNLTIESVSAAITVPAGTFKDCLKIKQKSDHDPGIAIIGYEWYAPKVGVVKSMVTITRTAKDKAKTVEHRVYELQFFKR